MRRYRARLKAVIWVALYSSVVLVLLMTFYLGYAGKRYRRQRQQESTFHTSDTEVAQNRLVPDAKARDENTPTGKSARHFKNQAATQKPQPSKKPPLAHTRAQKYHESTLFYRRQLNCTLLLKNDSTEQDRARHFFEEHRQKDGHGFSLLSPDAAVEIVQDCGFFKKIRNYITEKGSSEEQEFPLAYVITAHTDFEHVERLLRALYRPQHVFCIHLDKKVSNTLKQAIASLAACFPNVLLASDPQYVIYAHFSRLMADVTCMKDILASGRSWRYLINMAATEFPLKTNQETIAILGVLKGLNDIHESFERKVEKRWEVEYVVVDGAVKPSKKLLAHAPHNITVTKGQAYNTYSHEFVKWALSDQRALDFLEWSKLTYSPDEHFWGTLNNLYHNGFLHTPGGFYGNPEMKGYLTKFISWQGMANPRHHCFGKIIHNICVFSFEDLPILPSQKHLAANKFDLTLDPVAYSCMEEMLEKRTELAAPIDLQLYENLYFIRFKPSKS